LDVNRYIAKPSGEIPGCPITPWRFSDEAVDWSGTHSVEGGTIEVERERATEPHAPKPAPAPFVDPLPEGPGHPFGAMRRGNHFGYDGQQNFGPYVGSDLGRDPLDVPAITRESVAEAMRAPSPSVRREIPLMSGPGRVLLGSFIERHGVPAGGRIGTVVQQFAAEGRASTALANIVSATRFDEEMFGWAESARTLVALDAIDQGADPQRIALVCGVSVPERLWRPACTALDLQETADREARDAQSRSDVAVARTWAVQEGPDNKSRGERGTYEIHTPRGYVAHPEFADAAPDYTFPNGTEIRRRALALGLVIPDQAPHIVRQGDDRADPLPYKIATQVPALTDAEIHRVHRLIGPADTTPRPRPWGFPNGATRRRVEDEIIPLIVACPHPAVAQHYRECAARGCFGRPDVLARMEEEGRRQALRAEEKRRQLTMPAQCRDSEAEQARAVERQLAGVYERALADFQRAAGPGWIPWGSLVVTVVDEAGDAIGALADKVRAFFSSRVEPVTSEELARSIGVPLDSPGLHAACERAGWKKIRPQVNGKRERVWVPAAG
jgi:hypothetical protein